MKNSIIILFALIAFSSCKKTLEELRPTGLITEENVFVTLADVEAGAIGAYAPISGENIFYVSAIMSDEVKISSENRGQGQFLHKWVHTTEDGDAARAWTNLYIPIDRANRVLAALDKVSGDQAMKDVIRGEMLALRAWAHFELWRWYAKMPYDPETLGVPYMKIAGISQPARAKTSQNFMDIEADLTQAKTLIPASYTGGNLGVGRITRLAVSAMQARVALYKNDWGNAATFATEVINAVPLSPRASFAGIWQDVNNNEIVWELKRVPNAGVSTFFRDTNGDIFFQPSDKIVAAFDSTSDIRFPTYILRQRPGLGGDPDDTVTVRKYPGVTGGVYTNDIKMFRVAEMYLIRAEARAELGDLPGSSSDITTLRNARYATASPVVFTSKQAAIDFIYLERFRELAFEGHRYFDLKRRGLTIERNVTDSAPEYRTLDPSNYHYLFPIPLREVQANPNIQQNPGYQQ